MININTINARIETLTLKIEMFQRLLETKVKNRERADSAKFLREIIKTEGKRYLYSELKEVLEKGRGGVLFLLQLSILTGVPDSEDTVNYNEHLGLVEFLKEVNPR